MPGLGEGIVEESESDLSEGKIRMAGGRRKVLVTVISSLAFLLVNSKQVQKLSNICKRF